MKRKLRNILKWFVRIFVGLILLLLLTILLFYLFRGKIVNKALDYVNDAQPGEVQIGNLYLRPFMDLPDVSLRITDLVYSNVKSDSTLADSIPVLRLEDIYVSLDFVRLVKGEYKISKIRLGEGELNYMVGGDSVSNLERALGIRFGQESEEEIPEKDSSVIALDLESLQLRNLQVNYIDIPGQTAISILINGVESAFSYYPDTITASLMSHFNVNSAKVKDIVLDRPRAVSFSSSVKYDQNNAVVSLERSMLDLNDVLLEMEGVIGLKEEMVDLKFSAQNKGIELLNFLLSGVLDLDAIEQIGEGEIHFDGNIRGSFDNTTPRLSVNFSASDMGFKVNAINQSIKDIGFDGFATNGGAKDFSEAEFEVKNLHLSFPQGELDADLHLKNLIKPSIALNLEGKADLSILNEIIDSDALKNLRGELEFDGAIDGSIDKSSGGFLDDAGMLTVKMHHVSFDLPENKIENLDGELYIEEKSIGFKNMEIRVDSNDLLVEGKIDYLLPYFMGFSVDPNARLTVSADELFLYKFLGDSVYKEPLKDLGFRLSINAAGKELEKALEKGSIPKMDINLQNFHVKVPGYADVSRVKFIVYLDEKNMTLSNMTGKIGQSSFDFDASVKNYAAFLAKDSSETISLEFELSSKLLRARDLFTFGGEFKMLPISYAAEEMINLHFKGKAETSVDQLLIDSDLPNFKFQSEILEWKLKQYPLAFSNFIMDIEKKDSLLLVNNFQGVLGKSNLSMKASVANLLDTSKTISGFLDLSSDLLDIDEIMNYQASTEPVEEDTAQVKTVSKESMGLDKIDLPDLALNLDIREFRFEGNNLFALNGKIRLKPYKIIYLDRFALQSESGGAIVLDGQFNVSDSTMYMLSASLEIDTLNLSDFDIQLAMDDKVYSLEDNFSGILSADGIAEFFIHPDMSIALDTSTAMFNIRLDNGRVKKFTPLHAIAKYTGNKDLDDVHFGELRNSFTLVNNSVQIPLMSISSTIGLLLIEGEQGLGGEFLYLVRVPTKLIRGAAWNVLSNQQRKDPDEEKELETMEVQKFARVTVYGEGEEVDVKMGDKREKYK